MVAALSAAEWVNEAITGFHARWFIAMTIPRHERRVARGLRDDGVNCYIPIAYSRITKCNSPLFSGYVFANAIHLWRGDAILNPKVRSSLLTVSPVSDQGRLDRELRQIQMAEFQGLLTDEKFNDLRVGRVCRVSQKHPTLRGAVGTLIYANSKKPKFVLEVKMLGQAVGIDIDPEFLEVDDDAAA